MGALHSNGDALDEETIKKNAALYSVVGKMPPWPAGLVSNGLASFPMSPELLKPLQDVFHRLESDRVSGLKGLLALGMGCYEIDELRADPYHFGVSYADDVSVAADMSWVWAKDEKTLALFRPLYDATIEAGLLPCKDAQAPLQLWNASYIVQRGGKAKRGTTNFHEDYGSGVPPGLSFTLLTPLFELPADAGGLEYYPWKTPYTPDGSEKQPTATCLKYRLGDMVVFDGRLSHRTEPYDLGTQRQDYVRVLVSLFAYPDAPREVTGACRKAMYGQHGGDAYTSPSQWHFVDCSDSESDSSSGSSSSGA
eukprot:TRINITY_DN44507_c0_g1_i1.p1 TRINITY_DN44507_c0_g1~~TRINITY_DN44507_c0_g1_i1.p1  ORF type:complete len:333 (+),score=41.44 TRINITY_DN44507_c0_g1_i1:74-1000(+)